MIAGTLSVGDVMSKNVLFAHLSHSFTELCRLFFELNIHHLPVVDEAGKLIGIISANDVLKAYGRRIPNLARTDEATLNLHIKIEDIMSPNPVSIGPGATLKEAAELLTSHNIQSLPVLEGDQVVGIITSRDMMRHFSG
ncbi:MAG: CBS domain-containing protein [Phaeodactylibacter sp.]|nr:CBS domain-containing protein [Phaeodactylibacter sp.]MCB9275742.1 CBS domain-containing protein [Lewinellaceae bacterium]